MEDKFVTYPIAIKLKKLGFNEPCICGFNSYGVLKSNMTMTNQNINDYIELNKYDKKILSPLWQDVLDWLRKTYKIHINPVYDHIRCDGSYLIYYYNGKLKQSDLREGFASWFDAVRISIDKELDKLIDNG